MFSTGKSSAADVRVRRPGVVSRPRFLTESMQGIRIDWFADKDVSCDTDAPGYVQFVIEATILDPWPLSEQQALQRVLQGADLKQWLDRHDQYDSPWTWHEQPPVYKVVLLELISNNNPGEMADYISNFVLHGYTYERRWADNHRYTKPYKVNIFGSFEDAYSTEKNLAEGYTFHCSLHPIWSCKGQERADYIRMIARDSQRSIAALQKSYLENKATENIFC